jgi:hypothetical protein
MNMISNGAFQTEMDASGKQQELVKKLTAAWEKKNSKVARAGGVSLMALSLAACGDDDSTPFSQTDVDAAVAASEAEMIGSINTAYGTSFTIADESAVIFASIALSDNGPLEVAAASALVAQAAAEALAAGALVAQAAAEASAAAALVGKAAAEAQVTTAQAETAAAKAAQATAEASLATVQATYDALVAPKSLTFASTAAETLNGGEGSDTFTGSGTSFTNADKIRDTSSSDSDTANLTTTGVITPDISGVENVNLTINATAAKAITASSMSGVNTLTLTRGDVIVGDATITGNKTHDVNALDAADIGTVTITGVATTVAVNQANTSGVVINADTATGNFAIVGASTVNAAGTSTGDSVTVTAMTLAEAGGTAAGETAANANPVTVNAGAETIIIANGGGGEVFDGAVTVTGAAAKNVTIASGVGGVTITALGENGTIGTDGILVTGVDASGATVTTSYAGTALLPGMIDLDGSALTTDTATVSASGFTTLRTNANNQVETLNLSGNGAAATYTLTGAATTYNVTGSQNVTIAGNESQFDGKTLTDSSTGTSTINITTLNDSDLSGIGADSILVSSNIASKTLTLADGASVALGTDLTTAFAVAGKTAGATVNLSTADDTAASGATIDIQTGTLTASTNVSTLNIDATVGKLTMGTATTAAVTTAVNISGTKAVDLAGTTAASVTSTSTAAVSVNAANASLIAVTTAGGNDVIVMDEAVAVTVSTGAGTDTITVAAGAESSYSAGDGNDTINVNNANAASIVAGAGDDTVNIADDIDSDAVIVGGAGTDTLVFLEDSTGTTAAAANFAISGFEIINITTAGAGGNTISAAQFAGNSTFKLTGNNVADTLIVTNVGSAGANIDASNVTFDATQAATLNLTGKASLADVVTGSTKNDTITASTGGDTIDGNLGTDSFITAALRANNIEGGTSDSNGVVINLGSAAVTNTSVLAKTSSYTANTVTSVGAGEYAYTFAASLAANTGVTGSITNVENITGTAGADYIQTGAGANVIDGNAGLDFINLDTGGGDTVQMAIAAVAGDKNTIDGFTVGAGGDQFDLVGVAGSGTGLTAGQIIADANLNGGGGGAVNGNKGLVTIADAVTGAITATTIHAVTTGGTNDLTVNNADNVLYLLVDNGTDSALARVNAAGDTVIDVGEITVMAVFDGIADYSTILAANFTDFA